MIVGFTGTRDGLTKVQKEILEKVLIEIEPHEVHHGGCRGADDCFDILVRKENYLVPIKVHIHPSFIQKGKKFPEKSSIYPYKAPLKRNQEIVKLSNILIACPNSKEEIVRSGTWSTVRYAKMLNRKILIIYPDGNKEWLNASKYRTEKYS